MLDSRYEPTIDAKIGNLKMVERATTIGDGSIRVHTVEHVLSALSAMGIDNAIVEMDANEPPIGDGSAKAYVFKIKYEDVVHNQYHETKVCWIFDPHAKAWVFCTGYNDANFCFRSLALDITGCSVKADARGMDIGITTVGPIDEARHRFQQGLA